MENKKLSVIAYANGFTIWHYNDCNLKLDEMFKRHFFDKIYTLCARGDVLHLVGEDGYSQAVIVDIVKKHVDIKEISRVNFGEQK